MLHVVGENVDRLCTLELRPLGSSHGVIHPLYEAARQKIGEPLAMAAAKRLHEVVEPSDVVILTTGVGIPMFMPKGETDGPIGLAALARILAEGLGAVPIVLTEEAQVDVIAATVVAAGLGVRSVEESQKVAGTAAVLPFPADADEAKRTATQLLDELKPKAVISIEKLGPNEAGVTHSATGMPVADDRAQVEHLVEMARQRDVLTIGVGDNGNEIGFGLIQEAVREHKPYGRVCQCPCQSGLATAVATDVLVVAGTSNWGAYAIEACLAALLDRPDLIHSSEVESFMLEENVRNGGVDGASGRQVLQVDGTSKQTQIAFNHLFRDIVTYAAERVTSRPF